MCSDCSVSFVERIGEALPDPDKFNDAWLERAMTTLETYMLAHDAELNEEGRELAVIVQRATLIAFGEMLVEDGCCIAPGWLALLGTATAAKVGALPHQLAMMPGFLQLAVKARVKRMVENVVVPNG